MQAFGTADPTRAIVVGNDPSSGATHVFEVTSQSVTELPTRVPHTYARTASSPLGLLGAFYLYGGAPEIEEFEP